MLEDLDSLMEQEGIDAVIAFGSAFEVPDIFWLTGFRSPDSIIFFHNKGEESVVATIFHALDRIKKESFIRRTFDLTPVYQQMKSEGKRIFNHPEVYLKEILDNVFTGTVIGVPDHLPARIVVALQQLGIKIKVVPSLFTDARATKSSREIKMIKKAGTATMAAISKVVDLISNTEIGGNKSLIHKGNPLTVHDVKLAMEHFLLDQTAENSEDAIVAVGRKGFDWHYLGKPNDKLKANVPIIIDVFPRLKQEMYIADVTRTVVRGTPSKRVRQMYEAVYDAKSAVIDHLTNEGLVDEANLACYNTLERHGFESSRLHPDATDGMTHGLGHGIGLEVHETPSFYGRETTFQTGHVVAIEPGVYLKAHGGVRYENDFVITKGKPKRLTLGLDEPLYL
ncbi:MAG: M24 family metallopeptidase [Candidatus Thorarchaeota archaeon]